MSETQKDRPWLFRTYAGHSTAKASNELYRANLDKGQTGLSVAFDLPTQTGDITMHLSCTHHMAQAPTARERRVMYTSFRLPSVQIDSSIESRARINQAREAAYKIVSQ